MQCCGFNFGVTIASLVVIATLPKNSFEFSTTELRIGRICRHSLIARVCCLKNLYFYKRPCMIARVLQVSSNREIASRMISW